MSNFSTYAGGGLVKKFELLTSGTSWTLPTKLAGDTVFVSAIAGGEASPPTEGGMGGSYTQLYPYTVSGTVTYSIGAGGTFSAGGEDGSNTTFGTITLIGGGAATCAGARGGDPASDIGPEKPGGPYGSSTPKGFASNPEFYGGGGLMFGGTVYGYGGTHNAIGSENGAGGAILVEWWEYP